MNHLSSEGSNPFKKSGEHSCDDQISSGGDEEDQTLEMFLFQFIGEVSVF